MTAQSFLEENAVKQGTEFGGGIWYNEVTPEMLIKFAQYHVELQKQAIKVELEQGLETFGRSLTDDFKLEQTGNNLIDEAYPPSNIK